MHLVQVEDDQNQATVKRLRIDDSDDPKSRQLCLHQLLEHVAGRYSDKIALVCGDATLTFGELDSLANSLARVLVQRGIGNGDLVGVALDRSVDLVAVLLAVLKTGAAYVPIEPTLPAERIHQMTEDACPKLLITGSNTTFEAITLRTGLSCLSIEEAHRMMKSDVCGSNSLDVVVKSEDLAYVMYTSGSTGRPKGVEVSHGNVSNLLLSMQKEPGCRETDRLLAITTVSFDMAVLELFLPLLCGATTVIAQSSEVRDMTALVRLMERHQITIMQGTPAIWQMLLDSGWRGQPRLVKIFCGGEALPRVLADQLLACGDMMWNMYGPTEATVYASIWKVCYGHDVIIGSAITNAHLYVLDEQLSPVPLGHPGELYIGGAGVARGYRNNNRLSFTRFLDNPFHQGLMYRTGDVARFAAPGKVSVMGRTDDQIKIRGYRIEPGDIETAMSAHEEVSRALVICRDDRLVAYYVPTRKLLRGRVAEAKASAALEHALRSWLTDRLPSYMVPAFLVGMEAFPVTINGKIDRKALPNPVTSFQTTSAAPMPASELEVLMLAIWSRVLGHDRVGVRDNFFEIGGDSARVVRLKTELDRLLGRPVPASKLFEHYTIKALVAYLTGSRGVGDSNIQAAGQRPMNDDSEDIAIVSMACRLPGDITTPEGLWELLEHGSDAITEVPSDRWGSHDVGSDTQDMLHCCHGGFIPSINSFDIGFFGISPREAKRLDPSQYMMLETCWEGFERAGYTAEQLRGSSTGVFIGTSNILSHNGLNPNAIRDLGDLDGYTVTGSAGGTMSGRISYQLGLQGPAMTIDTACSSSLVTTHLACNALRQGECDMAVSGGISLILNPGLHVEFTRLQGMSPDGRCRSFSADAQGTGWSEGSVVVIMKRLSDAQRDGDLIHAVIRGTAVNHDGRSASLTTPNGHAQQQLIHRALAAARLQPHDVDYVEAHGTGTKLGDPIEATALAEVFGPSRAQVEPLFIGSIKSNIGHTQAAAGLVGLLKVTLAMQHGIMPQTLHITEPTSAVDWQHANMMPVLSKRPWKTQEDRLRRAGVSAFGIGGTNAHVIIQEPPKRVPVANGVKAAIGCPRVMPFLLSGDTDPALYMQAEKLHGYISSHIKQDSLHDVAYSLATTRSHLRRRRVLMAQNKADIVKQLESSFHPDCLALPSSSDAAEAPRLAMLFTGQGSQWPGMGKDLCGIYPVFSETLTEIAAEFNTQLKVPLLDVMWAEPGSAAAKLLDRTDFAQPALFSLEVALWRLWKSWGVMPDFVIGHSLGELVAAYVAGILDLPDACRLVAARGRLMQAQSGDFSMVSLEASADEVKAAIERLERGDEIDISLYNTPFQTVISGDTYAIDIMTEHFTKKGRRAKTVVSGHAFHSRHMDGMLSDFQTVLETVRFNPPHIDIVSGLDGKISRLGQLEQAQYWLKQIREPVRFTDAIQELASHGVNVFLELGPHQVLCGMGAACLLDHDPSKPIYWLPSLLYHKESASILRDSASQLHMRNVSINWQAYFKPFGCQRIQLPSYAFQRKYIVDYSHEAHPRHAESDLANETVIRNGTSSTNQSAQENFQFEITWQPMETGSFHPQGTWGFMTSGNNSTWATTVTATLSQAGIRLVQVEHLKHAEKLEGLICLWDSDSDVLSQASHFIAKALPQLQMAARTRFVPPLVWITQQAVGTATESDHQAIRLGAGPLLWGLSRTARNEHPELNLRLVDLDQNTTGACIPQALMLNAEPECAVRQDRVLVPRMQRIGLMTKPPSTKHQLMRTDGAILITGGLGHLGAHVARWLANHHGIRDLVLTSRHGMKASGADALVSELSKMGVRVTVMAGNIANQDIVYSIMANFSKDRPLRGVVHAAGVSDSGVLSAMTQERCETTIIPKVYGAWLLHQATRHMDLDLFLMFSSISGVLGMPGLANYAAANAYLDALAHWRCAQGLPATSVAYGTLAGDGGMSSRLGQATRSHLSQFGLNPLSLHEALEAFEEAAISKRALTVAAALNLNQLQRFLEQQGGSIPPLFAFLLNQDSTLSKTPSSTRRNLREILSKARLEQRNDIMLNMVRQVIAKALGFMQMNDLEIDRPLKDIGIDSLTAVQIRNHLATLTGLKLSVNVALLHPNLRMLSQFLLSQLQADRSSIAKVPANQLNMTAVRKGCLDSSFKFDKAIRDCPSRVDRRPKSVFLTGATGFVGVFILHELLNQGITTYCIVRADRTDQAQQRVVSTLQEYGLWKSNFTPLVKAIVGNIAQPLLGLTEQTFDDLAHQVDAICHSGALVDWMRPLQDYVGPNIVSAHEILRLASRGCGKDVHLVSTISTLPKHMGLDLNEGDLEYGYGTSKYFAERMVAAARWRGATASIYRLPYVTAATSTGHFRHDRGDFLHNLITGCLEMGAFPSVDADMSVVLPVDYLAKTVVAVMTRDRDRMGRDYDFLNTHAPSCNEFFKLVSTVSGGEPKEMIAFGAWKQQALDHAAMHPDSPLARIAAVLDSYTDETATAMFKGLPVGEHVFGSDDYEAPAINEQFVNTYLSRIRSESGIKFPSLPE